MPGGRVGWGGAEGTIAACLPPLHKRTPLPPNTCRPSHGLPTLATPAWPPSPSSPGVAHKLGVAFRRIVQVNRANLPGQVRRAGGHACASCRMGYTGVAAGISLGPYWRSRTRLSEAAQHLRAGLALLPTPQPL